MVAIGVPAEIWRVALGLALALALSKHYPPGACSTERGKDELGLPGPGGEGEVKALALEVRDVEVEVEVPVLKELCLLSMDSAFLPSSKANPKVSARRKINRIAKP